MSEALQASGSKNVFEKEETIDSWDSDYYHPIAIRQYDRAVAWMLDKLGVPQGATVLDAGCGPGVHSIRVARAGHAVKAIDLSSAMLREARRRVDEAGVGDQIDFEQADLTKLQFDDASFDYVFSWGVIIHIPDVEPALSELARVTRPGGRLALHVTNGGALDHKIEKVARVIARKPSDALKVQPLGPGRWYDLHDEPLWVWFFDVPALVRHLETLGFRLVARRAVEFTEIQRRFEGPMRRMLLRANRAWFGMGLPAFPSATNMLVLEKVGR